MCEALGSHRNRINSQDIKSNYKHIVKLPKNYSTVSLNLYKGRKMKKEGEDQKKKDKIKIDQKTNKQNSSTNKNLLNTQSLTS